MTKLKSGIKLLEDTAGTGEAAIQGDTVTVRLNGWLNKGQRIQTEQTITTVLGKRRIIPGIEHSIEGMKVSGKRKVKITPHLAYGEKGVKSLIPANAVLIYEIELLDIKKSK